MIDFKKIKNTRELMGLSQSELAFKIEAQPCALSLLENGKMKRPSLCLIYRIAQTLGVDINYFLIPKA